MVRTPRPEARTLRHGTYADPARGGPPVAPRRMGTACVHALGVWPPCPLRSRWFPSAAAAKAEQPGGRKVAARGGKAAKDRATIAVARKLHRGPDARARRLGAGVPYPTKPVDAKGPHMEGHRDQTPGAQPPAAPGRGGAADCSPRAGAHLRVRMRAPEPWRIHGSACGPRLRPDPRSAHRIGARAVAQASSMRRVAPRPVVPTRRQRPRTSRLGRRANGSLGPPTRAGREHAASRRTLPLSLRHPIRRCRACRGRHWRW